MKLARLDTARSLGDRRGHSADADGEPEAGQLPEIAGMADALDHRAIVLDGELVAHQGTPQSFYRLESEDGVRGRLVTMVRTPVTFVAFDLLWLDADQTPAPYFERAGPSTLITGGPIPARTTTKWLSVPVGLPSR